MAVCDDPAGGELLDLPSLRLLQLRPQVLLHLPVRLTRRLPTEQVRAQIDLLLPPAAAALFTALEADWVGTLTELVDTTARLHARGWRPPPGTVAR